MDLRKLPPSVLLALGLAACGDDQVTGDTAVDEGPSTTTGIPTEESLSGCLSCCLDIESTDGTTTGPPSTSTDSTGGEVSTGPCLSPPETTDTGTGTESGSDSGSSSDTGTGTEGSTGMMADEPELRAAAVERVLERGTLPPDVAARLRHTMDED